MDFVVTVPGHIAAYSNDGKKLWIIKTDVIVGGSSETYGLPGHHGPGVQAVNVDGDTAVEVIYLTRDSIVHVVSAGTGKEKWNAK